MTFARFLATPENRSALSAVQQLASCIRSRAVKRAPNPLYLHGPAGTGKTHLVSALVQDVTRQVPDLVVTNFSAGDFELLVRSAEKLQPEETDILEAARQCDLLIFEDLQHFTRRCAEACVQLFDHLWGRQIPMVFSAAVGPRLLDLPARLTSRLASGLVVGLEPLQRESRLALLQDKAQRRQLAAGRDVLVWLAEHLPGGGRQLEGALATLETLSRASGRALDVQTVAEHFREQSDVARPTMERITQRVSSYFHVKPRELQSSQRRRHILLPRQVSMYLARKLTALSFGQIGSYFGGRDHTTVLHACRKVEQALTSDPVLSGTVRQLHSELA